MGNDYRVNGKYGLHHQQSEDYSVWVLSSGFLQWSDGKGSKMVQDGRLPTWKNIRTTGLRWRSSGPWFGCCRLRTRVSYNTENWEIYVSQLVNSGSGPPVEKNGAHFNTGRRKFQNKKKQKPVNLTCRVFIYQENGSISFVLVTYNLLGLNFSLIFSSSFPFFISSTTSGAAELIGAGDVDPAGADDVDPAGAPDVAPSVFPLVVVSAAVVAGAVVVGFGVVVVVEVVNIVAFGWGHGGWPSRILMRSWSFGERFKLSSLYDLIWSFDLDISETRRSISRDANFSAMVSTRRRPSRRVCWHSSCCKYMIYVRDKNLF